MILNFKKEKLLKIALILTAVLAVFILYFYTLGNKIIVQNEDVYYEDEVSDREVVGSEDDDSPKSGILGTSCKNAEKRAYAVMMAADRVARPLSGVSEADLVFEMPVITDGITRYMAIFQCEEPKEIGSIRSARHDFINLALGLDAIYAHWGGSEFALNKLREGIIDNIDALVNPHDAYYRKSTARAPHNGFTSFERLDEAASKLGYRLTTKFSGYPHTKDESVRNRDYEINIPYPSPYNVKFRYDSESNSYLRSTGGFKEVDKNNNRQVKVKNLVVMKAVSKQIKDQYNDVDLENSGELTVYRNGEIILGSWEKRSDRYYFLNNNKEEIEFTPGKIWVSIIQPNQDIFIKNL